MSGRAVVHGVGNVPTVIVETGDLWLCGSNGLTYRVDSVEHRLGDGPFARLVQVVGKTELDRCSACIACRYMRRPRWQKIRPAPTAVELERP